LLKKLGVQVLIGIMAVAYDCCNLLFCFSSLQQFDSFLNEVFSCFGELLTMKKEMIFSLNQDFHEVKP